jgi:hypothetical protein
LRHLPHSKAPQKSEGAWRRRVAKNTLELLVDVYNITNRTNFVNPGGDRRLTATFLVPTAPSGGSGLPRQAQLGVRYTF